MYPKYSQAAKDLYDSGGPSWEITFYEWLETPCTKYNKDGTVYKEPEPEPDRFYTWFVLQPASPRMIKWMLGILGATIFFNYLSAFWGMV